jgi:hypothetical protein
VVTFVSASGDLRAAVTWADDGSDGDIIAAVEPAELARVSDAGLFHLDPSSMPSGVSIDLDHGAVLMLRPTPGAGQAPRPGPTSAADWLRGHPGRLETDNWYAARLEQPDAEPPVDIRTLWSYLPATKEALDAQGIVRAIAAFVSEQRPELEGAADAFDGLVTGLTGLAGVDGTIGDVGTEDVDVLGVVAAVVESSGGEPTRFDEGEAIGFPIQGTHGVWLCVADVYRAEVGTLLVLSSAFPAVVPPPRRDDAYVAFGHWNADQGLATLDLAAESGRASLRTPMFLDGPPSPGAVRHLIDVNIDAVEGTWELVHAYATEPDAYVT